MTRRLLDAAGAADYLGVGERMMRRLREERRIATVLVGRHVRFDVRDLDAYIAANRVEAAGTQARRRLRAVDD